LPTTRAGIRRSRVGKRIATAFVLEVTQAFLPNRILVDPNHHQEARFIPAKIERPMRCTNRAGKIADPAQRVRTIPKRLGISRIELDCTRTRVRSRPNVIRAKTRRSKVPPTKRIRRCSPSRLSKGITRHIAVLLSKSNLAKQTTILRIARPPQDRHGLIMTSQPIERPGTIAQCIGSIDRMRIHVSKRFSIRFLIDQKRTQSNGNIPIPLSLFVLLTIPLQQNNRIALAMLPKPHTRKPTKCFSIRRLACKNSIEIGCRRVEALPLERNVRPPEPVVNTAGIEVNRLGRCNIGINECSRIFEKMSQEPIPISKP